MPDIGDTIFITDPSTGAIIGVKSGGVVGYFDGRDPEAGPGGGAAAFTDLTDAPATITPLAVVVGNGAGTSLEQNSQLTYDDSWNAFVITNDLDDNGANFMVQSNTGAPSNNVSITADNGRAFVQLHETGGGDVFMGLSETGKVFTLQLTGGAVMKLTGIPTSDPAAVGMLYSDAGTLKISAG